LHKSDYFTYNKLKIAEQLGLCPRP